MAQKVTDALQRHRRQIIDEWAERMCRVSPRYQARPVEELKRAVGLCFDGLIDAIDTGDMRKMAEFVSWIATLRVELGFELEEIHQAFMLGRDVVFPLLQEELGGDAPQLIGALSAFQKCLQQAEAMFARAYHELRTARANEELRSLRAELACQRAAFEALVEAIECPVFVIGSELTLMRANPAAGKLVGAADSLEGQRWPDVLGEDVQPQRGAAAEAFASGQNESGIYRVGDRAYSVTALPVAEPSGNVTQVVVLVEPLKPSD